MTGQFTFSKEEKLSSHINIDRLFSTGKSFSVHPFKVFYCITDGQDKSPARVLIAVPRKKFRRAVDRNRLKRMIREAYRLNKSILLEHLKNTPVHIHIGLVYNGNTVDISYKEVEIKIQLCIDKLLGLLGNTPSPVIL
jgi:ribonuclease P protein component